MYVGMYKTPFVSFGLALTLLLSACSGTPEALVPHLEPQFGTAADDYATDVTVQKRLGHVYVAGTSGGRAFLRQYGRGGKLAWERRSAARAGAEARVIATDVDDHGHVYLAWGYGASGDADGPFISKLKGDGTLVWRKTFSDLLNMAVDGKGNLYLVGVDSVRKHAPQGALVWERRPNLSAGFMTAVAVAPSGNVIASDRNASVVKYDNNGNNGEVLFNGFYDVSIRELALDPNEEIYLGSFTQYLDSDYHHGPTVYALSARGNFRWRSSVVAPLYRPGGVGITTDGQGNVYLTGSYACERFYNGAGERSCDDGVPNIGDAFVRKLTASGTVTWTRRFGTRRFDTGMSVALLSDDELYIAGFTEGSLAGPNQGGTDAFLRRMDGLGRRIWTR